jgi:hypothetical protein
VRRLREAMLPVCVSVSLAKGSWDGRVEDGPESQAAPVKPRTWAARNAVGNSLILIVTVRGYTGIEVEWNCGLGCR